jgi:hypothetical protein
MKLEINESLGYTIGWVAFFILVGSVTIFSVDRYYDFADKAVAAGYTQKTIEGHDGVEWVKP